MRGLLRFGVALGAAVLVIGGCSSGSGGTPAVGAGSDSAGSASLAATASSPMGTSATEKREPPAGHMVLGLVVGRTKLGNSYRVVLAPARRRSDGRFVVIAGLSRQTYLIPASLVPDSGVTLTGAIELTTRGHEVVFVTIVGG